MNHSDRYRPNFEGFQAFEVTYLGDFDSPAYWQIHPIIGVLERPVDDDSCAGEPINQFWFLTAAGLDERRRCDLYFKQGGAYYTWSGAGYELFHTLEEVERHALNRERLKEAQDARTRQDERELDRQTVESRERIRRERALSGRPPRDQ